MTNSFPIFSSCSLSLFSFSSRCSTARQLCVQCNRVNGKWEGAKCQTVSRHFHSASNPREKNHSHQLASQQKPRDDSSLLIPFNYLWLEQFMANNFSHPPFVACAKCLAHKFSVQKFHSKDGEGFGIFASARPEQKSRKRLHSIARCIWEKLFAKAEAKIEFSKMKYQRAEKWNLMRTFPPLKHKFVFSRFNSEMRTRHRCARLARIKVRLEDVAARESKWKYGNF